MAGDLIAPRIKTHVRPGQEFGRLTVLGEERVPLTPGRASHGFKTGPRGARCRCECGREVVVTLVGLRGGTVKSCGCLKIEVATERVLRLSTRNVTHGLSQRERRHPLYSTWSGMMARCYQSDHVGFKYYGGRGISVHQPWHEAAVFIADVTALLGARPKGMTLDRIDNDRGYEPGNIRWADASTQAKNKRQVHRRALTAEEADEMRALRRDGAVLRELAERFGVSLATAHRTVGNIRT